MDNQFYKRIQTIKNIKDENLAILKKILLMLSESKKHY